VIEIVEQGMGACVRLNVRQGVFSPALSSASLHFARVCRHLSAGQHVLEVGTGCGLTAIFCAYGGAARVVATDINPDAVRCARENVSMLGLERIIDVREGDLFSPVPNERFGLILFNLPFVYQPAEFQPEGIERAVFDPGYRTQHAFFQEAPQHMVPKGKIIAQMSDAGDLDMFVGTPVTSQGLEAAMVHYQRDHWLRTVWAFSLKNGTAPVTPLTQVALPPQSLIDQFCGQRHLAAAP
jgi:methylase of polypeptide subunit release factors